MGWTKNIKKGNFMEESEVDLISSGFELRCEVLNKDNLLLFLGRITYFNRETEEITLEEYHGYKTPWEMIPNDTLLKVRLNNTNSINKVIVLEGNVTQSTFDYFLVHINKIISKYEGRQNFRHGMYLYAYVELEGSNEEKQLCTIIDISVSGIGIKCKTKFNVGDTLVFDNLRLRNLGPIFSLRCKILRSREEDEEYFYGCKFYEMAEYDEEILCQDILIMQAEEIMCRKSGSII